MNSDEEFFTRPRQPDEGDSAPPRPSDEGDFSPPREADPWTDATVGQPDGDGSLAARLGIIHLLVLMACVAGVLSVHRVLEEQFRRTWAESASDAPSRPSVGEAGLGTVYGIQGGLAVAGLVLLAARRLRKAAFPVHPGEYLWCYLGVGVVMWMTVYGWFVLTFDPDAGDFFWGYYPALIASILVRLAVFIWVLVGAWRRRRWRAFLVSVPIAVVAGNVVQFLSLRVFWGMGGIAGVLASLLPVALMRFPSALLLYAAVKDHAGGFRYPWTHWVGVGAWLAGDLFGIVGSLTFYLLR